jgi:hypothetical protein
MSGADGRGIFHDDFWFYQRTNWLLKRGFLLSCATGDLKSLMSAIRHNTSLEIKNNKAVERDLSRAYS